GRSVGSQLRALAKISKGLFQAVRIIRGFDPDMIVGVGGYASGPVALAGKVMGKTVVIHEQNMIPGLTNRLLARFADRIYVSFPDTKKWFEPSKTVFTGNPVRAAVLQNGRESESKNGFVVLVVGGSQGAHAVNQAVVDALDHLGPHGIRFIHQTGVQDRPWVSDAYEQRGVQATVSAFFEDMGRLYRAADLVVCRAGATTVSELTALGKPAVFIPFPFAANDHQAYNARYVAQAGGAEVILEKDLTGRILAEKISAYAADPAVLDKMAACAAALGRPDAASTIVGDCKKLLAMLFMQH
ncbi:MAG: undecaprenyldiphospho-muramoylpentapeptide beta-N-acetylglucosaminyltransferase, partial [Deltaproteobacteria bacterium]|nr:undecaprenyldiphospho-muramoylpentapeptide beta-N-acetylglucosaminyltransferase [Deltaproteobacteria bacterium]